MRNSLAHTRNRKSANFLGSASPQIANLQICLDEPVKLKFLNCHICGRLANLRHFLSPQFAICGTDLLIAYLCEIVSFGTGSIKNFTKNPSPGNPTVVGTVVKAALHVWLPVILLS
jgi:hypothetical protein